MSIKQTRRLPIILRHPVVRVSINICATVKAGKSNDARWSWLRKTSSPPFDPYISNSRYPKAHMSQCHFSRCAHHSHSFAISQSPLRIVFSLSLSHASNVVPKLMCHLPGATHPFSTRKENAHPKMLYKFFKTLFKWSSSLNNIIMYNYYALCTAKYVYT